ncbi:MAG: hypothetical protein L0226_13735 [Acidobacteria bacterium]|nr:hypothetical protein [Acidobacteriota bacterium]
MSNSESNAAIAAKENKSTVVELKQAEEAGYRAMMALGELHHLLRKAASAWDMFPGRPADACICCGHQRDESYKLGDFVICREDWNIAGKGERLWRERHALDWVD